MRARPTFALCASCSSLVATNWPAAIERIAFSESHLDWISRQENARQQLAMGECIVKWREEEEARGSDKRDLSEACLKASLAVHDPIVVQSGPTHLVDGGAGSEVPATISPTDTALPLYCTLPSMGLVVYGG